jgi:hypothetical protein
VLEKEQLPSDVVRHHLKRKDAKYLVERELAKPLGKTSIQMLVVLKTGERDPLHWLINLHKRADRGELLPPLNFYPPYNYPLPLWLLRSYE